jgi:carbon storage regulator
MIGDDIEIAVLSTSGEKVRLGISAGKEVPIYREEVYERIKEENGLAEDDSVDEALQELSGGKE